MVVSEGENIHTNFVSLIEQFEWQCGTTGIQTNRLRKLVGMGNIEMLHFFSKIVIILTVSTDTTDQYQLLYKKYLKKTPAMQLQNYLTQKTVKYTFFFFKQD